MATHIDAWLVTCKNDCGTARHGYHMVALLNGLLVCDGTCAAYAKRGGCRHIDEVRKEYGIPEPRVPTPISQAAREKAEALDFS